MLFIESRSKFLNDSGKTPKQSDMSSDEVERPKSKKSQSSKSSSPSKVGRSPRRESVSSSKEQPCPVKGCDSSGISFF